MKFRKKPVVIEAEQWDGTLKDMARIKAIFPQMETLAQSTNKTYDKVHRWRIGTLEGGYDVTPMDYIIRGIMGEYYPCREDIFTMTYEEDN